MPRPLAWYREFVPCAALRADVYAIFSFVPGSSSPPRDRSIRCEIPFRDPTFCSPQFADGNVSMLFELGHTCGVDGYWRNEASGPRGSVTGPMSEVGRTKGSERPDMIGVYFRPGCAAAFLRVAMSDLTDRTVAIDDVWGRSGVRLAEELSELDEAGRIYRLESYLLGVLSEPGSAGSIEMPAVAAHIRRHRGSVTIEAMAHDAGVSRQHFSRRFREHLGITPKLYCRLARFHSGLAHAQSEGAVDWAQAALALGYADQSHMIAEFRQFSALTPQTLVSGHWFHPFIERARRLERRLCEVRVLRG
jgi:AraC-like DNA-binding protein